MYTKRELLLLILLYFCCAANEAIGKRLSQELRVKTIQTVYGDKYDCIDFYKQPAFSHPELKNYTISYNSKIMSTTKHKTFSNIWVNEKGCPIGTVPIKRITKEDVMRAKLASEMYSTQRYNTQDIPGKPGVHKAVLRTKDVSSAKYHGGGMNVSLWNPVGGNNVYSSAHFIIQNDADSIVVGWTVNPMQYKDKQTRAFIYTNAGSSHCFNTQCPGFVLVRSDVALDMVLSPVSTPGGQEYEYAFFVYQDSANGGWYLNLGYDESIVGFWPNRIFSKMADSANYIELGGEIYCPSGTPCPPMGSGQERSRDTSKNAYFRYIQVLDGNYNNVDPQGLEEFSDKPECFADDEGNVGGEFDHLFLYGCVGQ